MPYTVSGKCVYKKKPDGSAGKKVGCTDGSVKKYLGALHANVNESDSPLPDKIDLSAELKQLDQIETELQQYRRNDDNAGFNAVIDKQHDIEQGIKSKLMPVIMQYIERGDFEGAKWFVGKSYGKRDTAGKVLLFRTILVAQDKYERKQQVEGLRRSMKLSDIAKEFTRR